MSNYFNICNYKKEEWAIKSEFYTLTGYKLNEKKEVTEAMEDYLEMIYRKTKEKDCISVKELSLYLNVRPSSVSKMVIRLKELNFIAFEKYGTIKLKKDGIVLGKYLLWRHNTLNKFFKLLNKEKYNLKQVEKIEHFIDYDTLKNIEKLIKKKTNF